MRLPRAGEIVRDIWSKGELGIVEKEGKHDLQTQADRWGSLLLILLLLMFLFLLLLLFVLMLLLLLLLY